MKIVRKKTLNVRYVMSVNPGNAGQMYLPYVGKKITRLLAMKNENYIQVYWMGHVVQIKY